MIPGSVTYLVLQRLLLRAIIGAEMWPVLPLEQLLWLPPSDAVNGAETQVRCTMIHGSQAIRR